MSNQEQLNHKVQQIERLIQETEQFAEENGLNFDISGSFSTGMIRYESSWDASWASSND